MLCLIPHIASQEALRIQGLSKDSLSFRRNKILKIGIPVFPISCNTDHMENLSTLLNAK